MKRKLLVVTTALVLVCALPTSVVHADPEPGVAVTEPIVEEYAYTQAVSSTLSFNGATATCASSVAGKSSCTRIEATQKLQKKTLWWWSDVQTWTASVNSNYLSMTNYGTASSSGTYRVRVEATVYSGSNSENVYADSVEKTK